MRHLLHVQLGLLAATLAPAPALAQYYYGGYDGGYHCSTAGEGYQRGMASRMQAAGERNLSNSQAAINMTEAQSRAIDNRTQATNAYWDRKHIYEENTAQERYERNQLRQKHRASNMLTSISRQDLDPTTGAISWPMVLRDDNYAKYRDPLTELFAKRARHGELQTDDYLQAKDLIKDFRVAVTDDRTSLPKAPLQQALRFLLKLNRELDANFS